MLKEIKKQNSLSYFELCSYLQKKYGTPPHNYFLKENCKSKNTKNSKTEQGLEIHHIQEILMINLSNGYDASKQSFEFQKPHNLVYCNLLEHFLLHIKIAQFNGLTFKQPVKRFVPIINNAMIKTTFLTKELQYKNNLQKVIENQKESYFYLLSIILKEQPLYINYFLNYEYFWIDKKEYQNIIESNKTISWNTKLKEQFSKQLINLYNSF